MIAQSAPTHQAVADAQLLIVGAGIGGLAAALALQRRGWRVRVWEQSNELAEIGAGIQLGPNAMRVLHGLGLSKVIEEHASVPENIQITDALNGRPLHRIVLGERVRQKYGASYVCIHRADLQRILRAAAQSLGVHIECQKSLLKYELLPQVLRAKTNDSSIETRLLIGADGLWSQVRKQLLNEIATEPSGQLAYRSLLTERQLPSTLQNAQIRLWWAPNAHVVFYPIGSTQDGQKRFNLVVLSRIQEPIDRARAQPKSWSLDTHTDQVSQLFSSAHAELKELIELAARQSGFQAWNLYERPALRAEQMAQGRVALLGDAAHPMLPYLAQGAAMALEDAACLARHLDPKLALTQSVQQASKQWQSALQAYAAERAARNARVMRTARRNGQIFHWSGLPAWARNTSLRLRGQQVLGMEWLYGYS